ncbi:MAG: RusA family crossover junction endodeoxyribonuclease [Steroidobacteraceae bacterium]|nr:RusA family crossover junction endodeoxyribonuclease [Steroidobacteraceae bacterium]
MTATSEIVLTIPGKPHGKGRPRFAGGRVFTDARTQSAEARVLVAWEQAGRPRIPDDTPIAFLVTQAVQRPRSHWRRDGQLSVAGQREPWPRRKPDFDNALKLLADALNGAAYRDDVDVVHAWFVRRWAAPGEPEHTTIVIRPMAAAVGRAAA